MEPSERIAVLESEVDHFKEEIHELKDDIKQLMAFIKEHMEKEEEDREVLIKSIAGIQTAQDKMKSFWGGIVFTVSALWAAGAAIVYLLSKGAH